MSKPASQRGWFPVVNLWQKKMNRRFGLYILVSLIAASVYLPGITNSLLADDWSVITRNMDLSLQDIFTRFHSTFAGWYRPMFDVLINLCFRLFGFNAGGYHLVAFALYIFTTCLVGDIAETITGERFIGLISALLFGVHSVHSEPVLWISSMNELLAGFFVLLSLKSYIAFRTSGKSALHYWLTGLFYILSLASKETSFFLPIMLVAYEIFLSRENRLGWHILQSAPFFLIQIFYLYFRLRAGSPYSTQVPLPRILVNGLYYFAVQVLMLPENYGYLSSLSLWQQDPLFPLLSVSMSIVVIGLFSWLYFRLPRKRVSLDHIQASKFTCCWSLVALSPVILTATGRTAFISSIGIAWTMGILLFIIWDNLTYNVLCRKVFVAGLVVFVCINLAVSVYRVHWWRRASWVTQSVIQQLNKELQTIPRNEIICLLGLPDHLNHAYTFRNAFPHIGKALYPGYKFKVVLDTETGESKEDFQSCIRYHYEDGILKR
jgi:hypothetical protein